MKEILFITNPWWEKKEFDSGIPRQKYLPKLIKSLSHKRAVLITGSRRVGKTTLLKQLIQHLITQENTTPKNILYVLLDHPRLAKISILEIVEEFRKMHLLNREEKIFLFFDEVQYLKDWEQEVKSLLDLENVKIFLSGSASTQLFQKTPFLTGRYEKIKIDPLNFEEFLQFKNANISSTEEYKYEGYLEGYIKIGGYPEYILQEDSSYFTDLLEAIIFKDIVYMHGIKNPDIIRDLLLLLADRNGHQASFTKLGKILGITVDTTKEYVNFLKQTFILEEIERFSITRSKKIYSAKKFYLHDTGLLHNLSSKFNLGSAAENILYKFLSASFNVNFYYENQHEIDFVFLNDKKKIVLVESKFIDKLDELNDGVLSAIESAAIDLKVGKVFMITRSLEKKHKFNDVDIIFVPLSKLLISDVKEFFN
ncbi:MAG: ATP-binding protein [Candidatus Moraniibacteriota bacterium]